MGDDCMNQWGCSLSLYTLKKRSVDIADSRQLRDIIAESFQNEWLLAKVVSCGSDANMYAVMSATNGETNTILIAAGSYVSGDSGPMQSWSTSNFSLKDGVSGVAHPSQVWNQYTREHTVPLPYCIPGVLSKKRQSEYENQCIQKLHLSCLTAKVKGCAYKCIMLELMLASNGASLSDRCLIMLGKLAECFDIHFIVDEIMTAGRTGTMLMTQRKPTEFVQRVTHVTLGKWLQKGLVIVSAKFRDEFMNVDDHTERRMLSIVVDCSLVIKLWKTVMEKLNGSEVRRQLVLKKVRLQESECWGEGTLIFVPVRRNGLIFGLKNRLLPLLDIDLPILPISVTKKDSKWKNVAINKETMLCVEEWKNLRTYEDDRDQLILELMQFLVESTVREHSLKTVHEKAFPQETRSTVSRLLRRTSNSGILIYKMVGEKRLRNWIVSDIGNRDCFMID